MRLLLADCLKKDPTLVCGGPGSGKTLLGIEFIVNGIEKFNEPGVILAFEEKGEELAMNVASLGFDLEKLQAEKKLKIDYVHVDKAEIEETGEYDLSGLFIRLDHAIKSTKAKRVLLDTIENLFAGLTNEGIIRSEIPRRLFQWLKDRGVTTVITGERGIASLTRQGLEEYVSDCVILLDHRVQNQVSTRLLRVVKYRGTVHGTNEYPFLIDQQGLSVLPITSLDLNFKVSSEKYRQAFQLSMKCSEKDMGFSKVRASWFQVLRAPAKQAWLRHSRMQHVRERNMCCSSRSRNRRSRSSAIWHPSEWTCRSTSTKSF